MSVTQYSAVPFDLGGYPKRFPKSYERRNGPECAAFGDALARAILGDSWTEIKDDEALSDTRVFLNVFGFGVVLAKTNTFPGTFGDASVGEILNHRRLLHTQVIAGNHELAKYVAQLRQRLTKRKWFRCPLHRRALFWDFPPYVMSFFAIHLPDHYQHNSDAHKKRLLALLEPSLVGLADTPFLYSPLEDEIVTRRIANVDVETRSELLVDYDVNNDVKSFVSWSNVIVLSKKADQLDATICVYQAMQIRLQAAWTMAHFIKTWSTQLQYCNLSSFKIDEMGWSLDRMYRSVDSLLHASIEGRYQRIYDAFVETSGLRKEIAQAKEGVSHVRDLALFRSQKREAKYRFVVEICLFFFGFCAFIPLVADLPLVKVDVRYIGVAAFVLLMLVLLRFRAR